MREDRDLQEWNRYFGSEQKGNWDINRNCNEKPATKEVRNGASSKVGQEDGSGSISESPAYPPRCPFVLVLVPLTKRGEDF